MEIKSNKKLFELSSKKYSKNLIFFFTVHINENWNVIHVVWVCLLLFFLPLVVFISQKNLRPWIIHNKTWKTTRSLTVPYIKIFHLLKVTIKKQRDKFSCNNSYQTFYSESKSCLSTSPKHLQSTCASVLSPTHCSEQLQSTCVAVLSALWFAVIEVCPLVGQQVLQHPTVYLDPLSQRQEAAHPLVLLQAHLVFSRCERGPGVLWVF